MIYNKIGILGLGLIGGSLAKTIRRKYPDITILAYDTDQSALLDATRQGVISEWCSVIDGHFFDCDLLFLCAPVSVNIELLKTLAKITDAEHRPLITDVSSMKKEIQLTAKALGMTDCFIGGHPMAGLETTGFSQSNGYLFENVYYIITPETDVPAETVAAFSAFLKGLDVLVLETTMEEHDFATACVSHVPHIISAALVNLVKNNDNQEEFLKSIAAGGFKDITRISSSSPDMWATISQGNKEKIIPVLNVYIDSLNEIKSQISSNKEQDIHDFFSSAKDFRDSISNKTGGALARSYQLYCDLMDEPGEIAIISTRLATHGVSIKNIGILHNREFEQGALNIEFYDAQALDTAISVLKRFNYHIYERD